MTIINWNDNIWKSDDNIKLYIRKYGNPPSNLNTLTHDELLLFAQKTEKVVVLNSIDQKTCDHCNGILDQCICPRCDKCYESIFDCMCDHELPKESTKGISKEIELASLKLGLKLFLVKHINPNPQILRYDFMELIRLICELHGVTMDSKTGNPFLILSKESHDTQHAIYSDIMTIMREIN